MASIDLNLTYVAPEPEDEMSNGSDDDLVDVVSNHDASANMQTTIDDLEAAGQRARDEVTPCATSAEVRGGGVPAIILSGPILGRTFYATRR
jgi:hypothetical protein